MSTCICLSGAPNFCLFYRRLCCCTLVSTCICPTPPPPPPPPPPPTTTTTTTIISEGPIRFDQLGVTLRKAGLHGQARNTLSSCPRRVLPIPASRPMPSGHFMCMALRLRKIPAQRSGCSRGRVEVRFGSHPGTKSRPNRHQAGPCRSPGAVLVVQVARGMV